MQGHDLSHSAATAQAPDTMQHNTSVRKHCVCSAMRLVQSGGEDDRVQRLAARLVSMLCPQALLRHKLTPSFVQRAAMMRSDRRVRRSAPKRAQARRSAPKPTLVVSGGDAHGMLFCRLAPFLAHARNSPSAQRSGPTAVVSSETRRAGPQASGAIEGVSSAERCPLCLLRFRRCLLVCNVRTTFSP